MSGHPVDYAVAWSAARTVQPSIASRDLWFWFAGFRIGRVDSTSLVTSVQEAIDCSIAKENARVLAGGKEY